jgi:hypothetical protein
MVCFHGQMADNVRPELEQSVDEPSVDGGTSQTVTLSPTDVTGETGSLPPTAESNGDKTGTQPSSSSNPETSKLGLEHLTGKARRALIRVSGFTKQCIYF